MLLKHPNRYILQFMEDLANIPLTLQMGDETKSIALEVVNVKSYTLRVKVKNEAQLDQLNLSEVTEERIDEKNLSFLLEALRDEFSALDFEPSFDMQQNLCKDMEFIFGPLKTGLSDSVPQMKKPSRTVRSTKTKPLILIR